MELAQLKTAETHDDGADVTILSPIDGKPTDVIIRIKGMDSKTWREAKKNQTQKIIDARADNQMNALDYDLMDAEALAEATISWSNITKDGKEYEFNRQNAVNLYANAPDIKDQLLAFLGNRANFISG
jgi:hypothetical protein